ncbi:MAG: hypothetical protein MHM6MM_004250 [Cercozoa sp. M6MM]
MVERFEYVHKVDAHTHILPKAIPDMRKKYGYGDWVRVETTHVDGEHKHRMYKGEEFFRDVDDNCIEPAARLIDCDADDVAVQVLSTVPVMFAYWAEPEHCLETCVRINDEIAEIVRREPRRFIGLGTVPMQHPELAAQELRRCVTELGFPGVQIGSNIDSPLDSDAECRNLSEPMFEAFWEACNELSVCVMVHPWNMMGFDSMRKYWLPWLVGMPAECSRALCSLMFGGVFERYPNIRFMFAHGGGSFPATIGRIEHGWRCRPDLCRVDNERNPRDYLGHFWLDSAVHDPVALDNVVRLVGEDKVLLGTDYPFPLGEWRPGKLIQEMRGAEWTPQRKQRLLWHNVFAWLGIDDKPYRLTAVDAERMGAVPWWHSSCNTSHVDKSALDEQNESNRSQ